MNRPTITGPEKRTITAAVRASQGEEFVLEGCAASFNKLSSDLGGFKEMIALGAFDQSLASGADIKCLANHDSSRVLGSRSSGTLQLVADSEGLKFRCSLNRNIQFHRDTYEVVRSGLANTCSFMFTLPAGGDDWSEQSDANGNKFLQRVLRNVKLHEISAAVAFPAYPGDATSVSARNQQGQQELEALRAKVAAMPGDWARQERANEIGLQIAADSAKPEARGMDDWLAPRCEKACRDKGLWYIGHDSDYVYAADPDDDPDEANCLRFEYGIDDSGNVELDEDSRTVLTNQEISSARWQQVKNDLEMRARLRSAAGITSR